MFKKVCIAVVSVCVAGAMILGAGISNRTDRSDISMCDQEYVEELQ